MSLLPGAFDNLGGLLGGPSWLPQGQRANPFGGAQPQQGGLRGLLQDPNFALQLLANSGPSTQPRSFGQILGQSAMQANQMGQERDDSAFKRKYMEAQIGRMENPSSENRFGAVSPDKYTRESIQRFEQSGKYGDLELLPNVSGSQVPQTMEGPDGSQIVWSGGRFQVVRPPKPTAGPKAPQGYQFKPDGSLSPIRGGPADSTQAGDNKPPTEGERTAGNYFGRMQAAEGKLGDFQPSLLQYMAARKVMNGGPTMATVANSILDEKAQLHYQAAADWVRAKLRKESGAIISPEEMEQEIKTYFPMPGDSTAVIEQKRNARLQAQEGMKNMGGRASGDYQQPNTAAPTLDEIRRKHGRKP